MKGEDAVNALQKQTSESGRSGNGGRQADYATPGARRLFALRLRSHVRSQWAAIRLVADWTVLLYLIIPGLLIGGRIYFEYWTGALPAWSDYLPFALVPGLFFLSVQGGALLFVQEADLLFLRQRLGWLKPVMLRGLAYSIAVTAAKPVLLWALALPWLTKVFGLSYGENGLLLALTFAAACAVKLAMHLLRVTYRGRRRWLRQTPVFALLGGLYFQAALRLQDAPGWTAAAIAVFAAAAFALLRLRIGLIGTFMNDVREDQKQRMRLTGLLLSQSIEKPRPTRHKPWIFRRSQPLLRSRTPEGRLAASGIKAMIRHPSYLKLYLQFTGVSLAAVWISPVWLKWALLAVLSLLLSYWLVSFWLTFTEDDFIRLLPFTKEQSGAAGSQAILLLQLPHGLLTAAAVCLPAFGWWGLLAFLPAGAGAALLASRLFGAIKLGH